MQAFSLEVWGLGGGGLERTLFPPHLMLVVEEGSAL